MRSDFSLNNSNSQKAKSPKTQKREMADKVCCSLKKNLNASRPSEHPTQGEKNVKTLRGGIIGCKDKTSSWHLNGFPSGGSNVGSTV